MLSLAALSLPLLSCCSPSSSPASCLHPLPATSCNNFSYIRRRHFNAHSSCVFELHFFYFRCKNTKAKHETEPPPPPHGPAMASPLFYPPPTMAAHAFQHLLSIFNRRRRQLPVSLPRCCCYCCCCCLPTNNKNDALYCALLLLLLSAPANTAALPPPRQPSHTPRSMQQKRPHRPRALSLFGHMLRPAGSSHMFQLATFRAVVLWHDAVAPLLLPRPAPNSAAQIAHLY